MSHAQTQVDNKSLACVLLQGPGADGNACFAYIGINLADLRALMAAAAAGDAVDMLQYRAIVLAHGQGHPNRQTKLYFEQKFGFSDESVTISLKQPG